MFATMLRIVPDRALASLLSSAGAKVALSSSFFTTTCGCSACFMVPSGPFTVTSPAPTVTSIFSGITTGYFAIRDMVALPLDDDAEHFAADTGLARAPVGHHAAGGGDDRHGQAVHHRLDVLAAAVDAQPRARYALDFLDHGLAR